MSECICECVGVCEPFASGQTDSLNTNSTYITVSCSELCCRKMYKSAYACVYICIHVYVKALFVFHVSCVTDQFTNRTT